jgi:hypothetical protein
MGILTRGTTVLAALSFIGIVNKSRHLLQLMLPSELALQNDANAVDPIINKNINYFPEILQGKPFLANRTRPDLTTLQISNNCNTKPCPLNATATATHRIIDYAILGFAKCGSTTVGSALGRIAQAPTGDTCANVKSSIRKTYSGWSQNYGRVPDRINQNILTGLKCPAGLEMPYIMDSWSRYQPSTLFIAGIRHPVMAFQSFYNMLIQNGRNLEGPYSLLPSCQKGEECSERGCPGEDVLCVDRLRYHVALAKLGNTPLGKDERKLLPLNSFEMPFQPRATPNKLFLYEVSQLTDTSQSRDELFWKDLSEALDLPPVHTIHPQTITSVKPGKKDLAPAQQARRNKHKMDVCKPENDALREILMAYAHQMADWICPYLLQEGTGVMVSDKEHFCNNVMEGWRQDPCNTTSSKLQVSMMITSNQTSSL